MHGMRDETKRSRTLAHLGVASGSLRRPFVEVGLSEFAESGSSTPFFLPAVRIPECIPCELRASLRLDCGAALVRRQFVS